MKKGLIKVSTHSGAEEIEQLFKRYNLLSLPVVNEDNRLVGVITHDDIYDMAIARV
jgi:magnesium transporter